MSYLLVVPTLDKPVKLAMSDRTERALELQWGRLLDEGVRDAFARRIASKFEELLLQCVDWDLKELTPDDLSYLNWIAKELETPIPSEAWQNRGSMYAFLEELNDDGLEASPHLGDIT